MSDRAPDDSMPNPFIPPPTPVSPKVTAATLGSLGAGVSLAMLTGLLSPAGQAYLGGLPPVVVFFGMAALPPVMAFLAGYVKRDRLQTIGAAVVAEHPSSGRAGPEHRSLI